MFCRMRKEKEEERFRIELEFNQKLLQEAEANTTTLSNTSKHTVLMCSHLTCYLLLFTLLNLVVQSFSPSKTETLEDEVRSESGLTYDVVNASFQEEVPDFVMCSRPTVTTQERDASARLSDQYRLVFCCLLKLILLWGVYVTTITWAARCLAGKCSIFECQVRWALTNFF